MRTGLGGKDVFEGPNRRSASEDRLRKGREWREGCRWGILGVDVNNFFFQDSARERSWLRACGGRLGLHGLVFVLVRFEGHENGENRVYWGIPFVLCFRKMLLLCIYLGRVFAGLHLECSEDLEKGSGKMQ